jgi:WD40 repeat protein
VRAVAFSPDGKWVATGSVDKTARVMEAATGREVARLTHGGWVRAVAFSPDGKWVATGSVDKTARVMEAATGREIHRISHAGAVEALWFPPDLAHLVTASNASYGSDIILSRHPLRPPPGRLLPPHP